MYDNHFISAILLMGGTGERFQSSTPKQFHRLSGKKVYLHTLAAFVKTHFFDEILLVCHSDWVEAVKKETESIAKVKVVSGGLTRQESSFLGLKACLHKDIVLIHDAVRPFVDKNILEENIQKAVLYGAVDTCIPSADTIVHSNDLLLIGDIPNRKDFLRGQTPQAFSYPLIVKAHEDALKKGITNATDDCQLLLDLPHPVAIAKGADQNIKITSHLDLFLAEQLLRLHYQEAECITGSLKGKTYAVIGATGGIGQSICSQLQKEEAHVIALSRHTNPYSLDLTKKETIQKAFEKIYEDFGPIDGLINAAGFLLHQPLSATSFEEIEAMIATNLTGLIYACKMAKIKEKGHIINLASSSFYRGRKNTAVYCASKAAVVNFTQALSEELENLFINTVLPQRTDTPMRQKNFPHEDKNSLLSGEAVAEAVLHLLKNQTLTGSMIEIKKE